MNKINEYLSPELKIIMLVNEDIVTESNPLGGGEDELPVIPLFL